MKALKLTALAALTALSCAQGRADQTNLVQNLNIRLFGVEQGLSQTNRAFVTKRTDSAVVTTRQVIAALGDATGNSFSNRSRLVVVTPLGGGLSSVQVRDGVHEVDVTGFFVHQGLSERVERSFSSRRTGRTSGADYSVQQFALQDAAGYPALALHFSVTGLATERFSSNGSSGQTSNLSLSAAGAGDQNGHPLVLRGSVSVQGRAIEVVSSTPVPGF